MRTYAKLQARRQRRSKRKVKAKNRQELLLIRHAENVKVYPSLGNLDKKSAATKISLSPDRETPLVNPAESSRHAGRRGNK